MPQLNQATFYERFTGKGGEGVSSHFMKYVNPILKQRQIILSASQAFHIYWESVRSTCQSPFASWKTMCTCDHFIWYKSLLWQILLTDLSKYGKLDLQKLLGFDRVIHLLSKSNMKYWAWLMTGLKDDFQAPFIILSASVFFFPYHSCVKSPFLRVWNETTTFLRLRLFSKSHLNLIKILIW